MLMEHNKETYEQFKAMLLEHRECCLIAATGAGKTYITLQLIKDLNLKALIISPRVNIQNSWIKKSKKYGIQITSTTYTNLYFNIDDFNGYDIYIFDEAHHMGSAKWGKAINDLRSSLCKNIMVVGLTATPERYETSFRKQIIDISSALFNDHIVYGYTLDNAIKLGIFSPATYVCAIFNTNDILKKYSNDISLELKGRLDLSIQNAVKIDEILKKHTSSLDNIKGIVFVETIDSVDEAYDLISSVFPNLMVESIHSRKSKIANTEIIEEFEKAESGFIIAVDMLNEGIHISGINTIVMLRKTFSPTLYNQQVGRGFSSSANENTIIFDFVGNVVSIEKTLSLYSNTQRYKSFIMNYNSDKAREICISDQCIIYDYASDILEVLKNINDYRNKNRKWTQEEDDIIRNNYKDKGAEGCSKLLMNRTIYACRSRAQILGLSDSFQPWTEEEDNILRENYPKIGSKVFELIPNRTVNAIKNRVILLGLRVYDRKWSEDEISILRDYYPSASISTLMEMLPNRSYSAIRNTAVKYNIIRNDCSWTEDEDNIILINYPKIGEKVVELLPNRTKRAISKRANILGVKRSNWMWTEEEDNILRENYPKIGKDVVKLLPGRGYKACYTRANALGLKADSSFDRWTEEEDNILREYYPKIGVKVIDLLPNRSISAIKSRAKNINVLLNRLWTEEEDNILRENYSKNIKIEAIAELLPGRTIDGVRARVKYLGICNRITRWTEEEDNILRENYSKNIKIEAIAELLPGRTTESIRKRISYLQSR